MLNNETFRVNQNDDFSISRCEHDISHRFTMISNDLIRDKKLSPDARMVLIFLLSNKNGWEIIFSQVLHEFQDYIGRDRMYKIFDECVEIGYMKKITGLRKMSNGGKQKFFRYFISESPKFKKFNQLPENQDTGGQYTGNQDSKEDYHYLSQGNVKEDYISSSKVPQAEPLPSGSEEVWATPSSSKEKEFSPEIKKLTIDLVEVLHSNNPDWKPPISLKAIYVTLELMIRLDGRLPQKILEMALWVCNDEFWASKIYKPNPAAYLRKEYARFSSLINQKPKQSKRKFAPSSDNQAAEETLRKMDDTAI